MEGTIYNVNWANVFWVRNGANQTPGNVDYQAFLDNFLDLYKQHFSSHMHASVVIAEAIGIYYGPAGGDLGAISTRAGAGTQSGVALPNNCATCITWHVQQRYRGGHPRTYLPPPAATSIATTVQWADTHRTGTTSSANQFHSAINGITHGGLSDLHLGTVSFVLRNAWRTPPVFRDYVLNTAQVDARIDTMRRRLGPDIV